MKGTQIILETLLEQDVDLIFGYPGGAVLDIYDELYNYKDKIHHVLTSHEQGAAHAADGYSRSTGKTGVVLATSGPGATNLVTGIATAYMDSIPMVAITGNVSRNLIGKDSFQEIYITGITLPITKHNMVVRNIKELAQTIRDAFRIANSDRKGPVLVDIPKDIMNMEYEYTKEEKFKSKKPPFTDFKSLDVAAKLINESKKPVLYCGGGIMASDAVEELQKFIKKTQIPTCNTIMGIGNLDIRDSLTLGMVGMHGRVSTNTAIEECDLLLAFGVRFSDRVALNTKKFAPNAKIIHLDIDPSEIGKNVEIDLSLIGDCKEVLNKLIPIVEKKQRNSWLNEIEKFRTYDYKYEDDDNKLNPHEIMSFINSTTSPEDILVTDVGQHQMWAAQNAGYRKPRTFLTSGGLGTMGFGYGAALGAKIGNKDKHVIHITGDGSFHMNLNEVPTSISNDLKIITLVFNNKSLGLPKQWQHYLYNDRFSESSYNKPTNYIKLAEAFGAYGYRADNLKDFKEAFSKALEADKSVIIDCIIDENQQVLPMIPAGKTIKDLIIE